jgi:hypothetical protein
MRTIAILTALLSGFFVLCAEKPAGSSSRFPPEPVEIIFGNKAVHHIFPVVRRNSIGIVYGRRWAIGTIKWSRIWLDNFPQNKYGIPTSRALRQCSENFLYVRSPKSIDCLDWNKKKMIFDFMDESRSMQYAIGIVKSKITDYNKVTALSLFYYEGEDGNPHYQFVLDDIFNKKRLKELPIPPHLSPLAAFFTPSYIFYYYRTVDSISPWMALDNNLDTISHPLASLLNSSFMDSLFFIGHEAMLVSEEQQHALIPAKNRQTRQEALYLAQWRDKPGIHKIPFDTAIIAGERSLLSDCSLNIMSPSGKWCFFKVDGYRQGIPDGYFLIYLDPAISAGSSQPIRLNDIENIEYASWMTSPEGLVLYGKGKFLYYDLSIFDQHSFTGG